MDVDLVGSDGRGVPDSSSSVPEAHRMRTNGTRKPLAGPSWIERGSRAPNSLALQGRHIEERHMTMARSVTATVRYLAPKASTSRRAPA